MSTTTCEFARETDSAVLKSRNSNSGEIAVLDLALLTIVRFKIGNDANISKWFYCSPRQIFERL